ncbi:MAG: tRNA lysidine(34) synthetase TilS [Candidatus Pacebacteria bacterium]|nr:tRNA lysidine(34) synthetase TilS [Candidatus Paceibacterota bacterium]
MKPAHPTDFLDRVRATVHAYGLFENTERILAGYSGGADSTALLLALHELATNVTAVHLHHGLRGAAADRDAKWCEDFCSERNIDFECHHLHVLSNRGTGESIEVAARRCRLEFWRRRASQRTVVALGHHADDCVEDLLLRLSRGANTSGLTGLRPKRTINGVCYIRPPLGVRRHDKMQYLESQGVQWCEDHTNRDVSIRRNAVRHQWLPLIRETVGGDKGLHLTLDALRHDADYLDRAAQHAVSSVRVPSSFRTMHPALQPRALRLWLQEQLGNDHISSCKTIERIRNELNRASPHPRTIPAGNGIDLEINHDSLTVKRLDTGIPARSWKWREEPSYDIPEADIRLQAVRQASTDSQTASGRDPNTELFSADALPPVLAIRSRQPGDRMVPFGRASAKKIKDLLIDTGIPRHRRERIPLVLAGTEIIWAVGVRRAEFGRIDGTAPGEVVCLKAVKAPHTQQQADSE